MDVGEKLQCVTESFEVVIGRFGWFTGGNRSLLVFVIAIVLVGQRRWFDGGSGCLWVIERFFGGSGGLVWMICNGFCVVAKVF